MMSSFALASRLGRIPGLPGPNRRLHFSTYGLVSVIQNTYCAGMDVPRLPELAVERPGATIGGHLIAEKRSRGPVAGLRHRFGVPRILLVLALAAAVAADLTLSRQAALAGIEAVAPLTRPVLAGLGLITLIKTVLMVGVIGALLRPSGSSRSFAVAAGIVAGLYFLMLPLPYVVEGASDPLPTQPSGGAGSTESGGTEPGGGASGDATAGGGILLTSVSVRQATPLLLLQAQFDSSIEISPMEEVLGGANSGQLEASANREMSDSQAIAQVLGARAMGHTATLGGDGVIVTAVVGGPNESVFKIDDVIVAVEGSPVDSVSTLHQRLEELGGDREISLQVQRSVGGPVVSVAARTQATVTPSGNQSQSPIAVALLEAPPTVGLGISGRTLNPTAVVDGEIEMNSAGLSGPSGGLAWTLAVIDKLSGGELTDGRRIAVTGTITESGQVGAIGGVMHKLDGAISGGSELFLYPSETGAGEVAALQEKAQGRIKLVAVASLDEALTELGFSPPTTAQNEI